MLRNSKAGAVCLLRSRHGVGSPVRPTGALFISLYAIGRVANSLARSDRIWAAGMQEAHFIALIVVAVCVPLLAYKARLVPREEGMAPAAVAPKPRGTRAERSRRRRR